MTLRFLLCLVILVRATSGEENVTSYCRIEQVFNCTRNLDILGKEIAPLYTSTELDSLCRRWAEVEPCLAHVAVTCALEKQNATKARNTFEEIVARKRAEQASSEWIMGYEYLCYEGRSGYPMVRDCISNNNNNITQLSEECYKTYENHTWWLDPDDPLNTHKYCKAARVFFDCMKKVGKEQCGSEFADWVWNFQEELWSSHLYHIECLVGNKFSAGEIFIVSLCGTATVICIILSILSFVCKPKLKKPQKGVAPKTTAVIRRGHSNLSFLEEIGESSSDPSSSTPTRRLNVVRKTSAENT